MRLRRCPGTWATTQPSLGSVELGAGVLWMRSHGCWRGQRALVLVPPRLSSGLEHSSNLSCRPAFSSSSGGPLPRKGPLWGCLQTSMGGYPLSYSLSCLPPMVTPFSFSVLGFLPGPAGRFMSDHLSLLAHQPSRSLNKCTCEIH